MIEYGPIKLREIEKRDMELLRGYLNDPEIASSVVDYAFPVSSDSQEDWFINRSPHDGAIRFMIEAQGTIIGTIIFSRTDPANKVGEVGYKVAKAFQGNNYATLALRAMQRHMLEETDIECIASYNFKTNVGSRRVLEKAGFEYEGMRRKHIYKHGKRQDVEYWLCCREHFDELRKDMVED